MGSNPVGRNRFFCFPLLAAVSLISHSSEKERKPLHGSLRCSVTHARRDVIINPSISPLDNLRRRFRSHTPYSKMAATVVLFVCLLASYPVLPRS